MIWNEILCLGDSLTYGARDRYGRSYPAELGKILSQKTKEFYICHNYGINGETSSDLLRRSWNIIKSNRDCKICLLLIGTNDTKKPTPLSIYEDNLIQIIQSIQANGMIPIVGTLPTLTFSPYYAKNRNWTTKYNKVIKNLSEHLNFDICLMDKMEEYLIDGVHFTHEGYNEMAKRWSKKDSITKVAVVGNTRLTLKGLSHLKLLPNVEVKLILGLSEKSLAQKVNSVSYDSLLFECDDARLIKSDQWIEFEIYCIEENIDLIISLGDSRIVPESIINYFDVIGNHGAVLPDVQGGASLVWGRMLNNGEWGVSIMKIDKQIDSGDILNVKKFKYNTDLSQLDFCEKCDDLTIQALEEVLKGDYNKIQNTKWDVKVAKHTDSLETVKLLKYCIENNLSIYLPPRTPQDSQIKSEWDDSFKFCFKIANDNPYPKYNE